jgi:zinc D-Ala-D-Ala carboxypeptidase
MNPADIQRTLNGNGFPCGKVDGELGPLTKLAVTKFQEAFNIGPPLRVDGIAGPITQAALGNLPHLSEHFVVDELRSHGNGDCFVKRELLSALEVLRDKLNLPIHVISAYRDPQHNTGVGGANDSMHLWGLAADIPGVAGWRAVAGLQVFSGIGDRHGAISHVDLRHLSRHNQTPSATPQRPARWTY